jgi:hypothetical protein
MQARYFTELKKKILGSLGHAILVKPKAWTMDSTAEYFDTVQLRHEQQSMPTKRQPRVTIDSRHSKLQY